MRFFLDFGYIMHRINRYLAYRFTTTGKGWIYTQGEANLAYQKLNWEIAYHYSFSLKTFATALFYLPMYPPVIFYAFLILLVHYWTEKVNFRITL